MGNFIKGLAAYSAAIAIFVSVVYGYIANIVHLVSNTEPVGMVAGRVIGIFIAPLGIILGYF